MRWEKGNQDSNKHLIDFTVLRSKAAQSLKHNYSRDKLSVIDEMIQTSLSVLMDTSALVPRGIEKGLCRPRSHGLTQHPPKLARASPENQNPKTKCQSVEWNMRVTASPWRSPLRLDYLACRETASGQVPWWKLLLRGKVSRGKPQAGCLQMGLRGQLW